MNLEKGVSEYPPQELYVEGNLKKSDKKSDERER